MKLRTIIIDDEPLAHKVILEYSRDLPSIEIVGQFHLATEALTTLRTEKIDLIFLDINMPKIKGLDFLKTLHQPPTVIITSAYEEYALKSFELDVCDYLLKPYRFDRFLKAVNKAVDRQVLQQSGATLSQGRMAEEASTGALPFFIKSDKRLVQLKPEDIYYLESYGNYVKVWLEKEYHLTLRTLSSFEEQLPKDAFFRTHKSFMINKFFIDYIEGNMVRLKNGKSIPVGKQFRSDLKSFTQN